MSAINLNYDSKYDILYARLSNYTPSYGDDDDGIITFYSIATDEITGMAIYDVKQRLQKEGIDTDMLPIPIDLNSLSVQTLLNKPENGFKCTLQLA